MKNGSARRFFGKSPAWKKKEANRTPAPTIDRPRARHLFDFATSPPSPPSPPSIHLPQYFRWDVSLCPPLRIISWIPRSRSSSGITRRSVGTRRALSRHARDVSQFIVVFFVFFFFCTRRSDVREVRGGPPALGSCLRLRPADDDVTSFPFLFFSEKEDFRLQEKNIHDILS